MQTSEFSFVLKASSLEGVGVFATHDIKAGTQLLSRSFRLRKMKVKDIPAELLKYCAYISDEECLCPEQFDRMEIGWFINHSSTPNIARPSVQSSVHITQDLEARPFYAIKDIKAGDEILVDYNYLGEPENLKEDFYKQK